MTNDGERPIGCEEALRRLAAYLDGELDAPDHRDVERHLEACRSCYSRAEFERRLQSQLATVGRREPDPAFGARLRGLVRRFTHGPDGLPPTD
jgi:anti-sigma factor (TIGR02949 family)